MYSTLKSSTDTISSTIEDVNLDILRESIHNGRGLVLPSHDITNKLKSQSIADQNIVQSIDKLVDKSIMDPIDKSIQHINTCDNSINHDEKIPDIRGRILEDLANAQNLEYQMTLEIASVRGKIKRLKKMLEFMDRDCYMDFSDDDEDLKKVTTNDHSGVLNFGEETTATQAKAQHVVPFITQPSLNQQTVQLLSVPVQMIESFGKQNTQYNPLQTVLPGARHVHFEQVTQETQNAQNAQKQLFPRGHALQRQNAERDRMWQGSNTPYISQPQNTYSSRQFGNSTTNSRF